MQDFLLDHYDWLRALHVIAVISFMAGMLYLPRLFLHHAGASVQGEASQMPKTMVRRLLRYIINPAMVATYVFGFLLAAEIDAWKDGWFHAKLGLVLLLTAAHHMLARHFKAFREDRNTKSQKYFRLLNEVPTVFMIGIVFLVVAKPF